MLSPAVGSGRRFLDYSLESLLMLDLVEPTSLKALDELAQRVRGIALAGADESGQTDLSALVSALYFEHLSPADKVLVSPTAAPYVRAVRGLFQLPEDAIAPPDELLPNTWVGDFLTSISVCDTLQFTDRGRVIAVGAVELLGHEGTIEVVEGLDLSDAASLTWVITHQVGQARRAATWREGLAQLGWHTITVGQGSRLRGAAEQYPELGEWLLRAAASGARGYDLRAALLDGAPASVWRLSAALDDADLEELLLDSGGNHADQVSDALAQAQLVVGRPRAIFVQLGPSPAISTSSPYGSGSELSLSAPPRDLITLRAREFMSDRALTVSRVTVPSVQLAKQSKVSTSDAVNRAIKRLRADDALGSRLIDVDSLLGPAAAVAKAAGIGRSWRITGRALMPVLRLEQADLVDQRDSIDAHLAAGARVLMIGTSCPQEWLTPIGSSGMGASVLGENRPRVTVLEPAYAQAASWLVRGSLERMGDRFLVDRVSNADQGGYFLKVSEEAVDQLPFEEAAERIGSALLRRMVLGGAYRLREAPRRPGTREVQVVASGRDVPLALAVAEHLEQEALAVHVVDVTSADRLSAGWRRTAGATATMRRAFADRVPVITLGEGHEFDWLATALAARVVALRDLDAGLAAEVEWSRKATVGGSTVRGLA